MNKHIIPYKILNCFKSITDASRNYPVLSFDIFDTLISRRCGNPQAIFDIVEKKFNDGHEEKLFDLKGKRIESERRARQLSSREEISIDDIYDILQRDFCIDSIDEIKRMECEVEIEQAIPNKDIVTFYKSSLKEKHVIITSDMYLKETTVKKILENCGIPLPEIIYLSSTTMLTKRSGSIFRKIKKDLCTDHIIHIGDNLISDYMKPRMAGLGSYII